MWLDVIFIGPVSCIIADDGASGAVLMPVWLSAICPNIYCHLFHFYELIPQVRTCAFDVCEKFRCC